VRAASSVRPRIPWVIGGAERPRPIIKSSDFGAESERRRDVKEKKSEY
jgi:hypothetical protein